MSGDKRLRTFHDIEKFSDMDIVFFHTEAYPYVLIQDACTCEWCHVSIVLEFTDGDIADIRDRYYAVHPMEKEKPTTTKKKEEGILTVIQRDKKRKYLLESTTDNLTCAVTGKFSDGVKLTLLEKNLKRCDPSLGNYYGIKKVVTKDEIGKEAIKTKLARDVLPGLLNNPYEKDYSRLVKAWVRWVGFKNCCSVRESDESSIFCTELIAHLFTEVGLLDAYHEKGPLSSRSDLQKWGKEGEWRFCEGVYWHCQWGSCSERKRGSSSIDPAIDGEPIPMRDTYYTDEDLTVWDFTCIERRFPKGSPITYETLVVAYNRCVGSVFASSSSLLLYSSAK